MWVYILSESSFPGCFLSRSRGVFHFLPPLHQSCSGFLPVFHFHDLRTAYGCVLCTCIYTACALCVCTESLWRGIGREKIVQRVSTLFPHENRPVYPNIAWHLWGQTQIRGDMKKFSHTMMSLMGKKRPVRLQLLFGVWLPFLKRLSLLVLATLLLVSCVKTRPKIGIIALDSGEGAMLASGVHVTRFNQPTDTLHCFFSHWSSNHWFTL